jgi:hypothetical protein
MSEIIKKAKVLKESLPPVSSITGEYSVRYRIISEDKNRTSSWSSVYSVDPNYTYVPGKINVSSSSGVVRVAWDAVTIKIGQNTIRQAKDYDIFVKWSKADGIGDWKYVERITTNSTSFVVPDTFFINGVDQSFTPNRVTVEVYLIGEPVSRDYTALRVYNPAIHTV